MILYNRALRPPQSYAKNFPIAVLESRSRTTSQHHSYTFRMDPTMSDTHANAEQSDLVELPIRQPGKASATLDTSNASTALLASLKSVACHTYQNSLTYSHRMLQDERDTDVVITCGKTKWKCHKAVLFARCPALQLVKTPDLTRFRFPEDSSRR
jgi:hypothetical protein